MLASTKVVSVVTVPAVLASSSDTSSFSFKGPPLNGGFVMDVEFRELFT